MPRDPNRAIRAGRTHIPAGRNAAADARRWAEWLAPFLSRTAAGDLRVAISELVTNSVLHAGLLEGQPIHPSASVFPDRVSVEVCDCGSGFSGIAPPTLPAFGAVGGRGLFIVQRLTERMMIDGASGRVRFDLTRGGPPGPPAPCGPVA